MNSVSSNKILKKRKLDEQTISNIVAKKPKIAHLPTFSAIKDVLPSIETPSEAKQPSKKKKKVKKAKKPVGKLQPVLKQVRAPQLSHWKKFLQTEMRTIYGLDMSLTNPGLCVLHPKQKKIHLYCFRNRSREKHVLKHIDNADSIFYQWTLQVSLCPSGEFDDTDLSLFRFNRYEQRIKKLLALIGPNTKDHILGIEGYSYQSSSTPADTMLKELGGCMRWLLCTMKHNILEIPPSTVKKMFSGEGKSTKVQMYQAFVQKYNLPDLFHAMNLKRPKTNILHPIEDIVDAFAVAMTTMMLCSMI